MILIYPLSSIFAGGSMFQWHPELKVGFGFTCTKLHWYDMVNLRTKHLQAEVLRCIRLRNK